MHKAIIALTTLVLMVAQASSAAEVQFTSGEYFLNEDQLLWRLEPAPDDPKYAKNRHYDGAGTTMTDWYFAQVAVQDTRDNGGDLRFAVEALPDRATFQRCEWAEQCHLDVEIAVRPDSGLLFTQWSLPVEERGWPWNLRHNMNGWPVQRVGLSVEDAASGLKVYKDVLIKPPVVAPDCHDYPVADEKQRICHYHRENLPPRSTWTTAGGLLDDVGDLLVQPKANYRLVFAEEFDGTSSTEDESPLAALDTNIWSYRTDVSAETDSNDVPCGTVQDGHLHMAKSSLCAARVTTLGKLAYQYGYLEAKFTAVFGADRSAGSFTHAFVIGNARRYGRWDWPSYGLEIDTREDFLAHVETEVDFMEFGTRGGLDSFNQYFNHSVMLRKADVTPHWSRKRMRICHTASGDYIHVCPSTVTSEGDWNDSTLTFSGQMTFVKGLEWTPRGYRTYIKVEGHNNDDFSLYPKNKTRVAERKVDIHLDDGTVTLEDDFTEYRPGTDKHNTYFETWKGKLLEQVGVSHMPLDLHLNVWGPGPTHEDIRSKLKVDYIRIFKPENNYADMEPVFK